MKISTLLKRYPVLSYFSLTFLISWGAILVLIAINGMPVAVEEAQAQLPVAILGMLLGPAFSGLLMIGLVNGRAGYRDMLARLFKWRVGIKWYAIALLTAPLVFVVSHFILSRFSPVYRPGFFTAPDSSSLIMLGVMSAIVVGISEELGWFGFAIPEMRRRHSVLATGLFVGVIWGAWHIMGNDIWAIRTYSGDISPPLYAVLYGLSFLIGQLPPFRILMVWAYERTGSLLLMMLMHFSLTACSITFSPTEISGLRVVFYSLAVGAAMWVVMFVILRAQKR